jgi:hypothetical protein
MQVRRLALGALFALALLAPSSLASAQTGEKPGEVSCCQMTSSEKTDCVMVDHRCPLKPAEAVQCCSACFLTLALIDFSSAAFVFDHGTGEIFKLEDLTSFARPAQPPYPPPRFA